MAKQAKFQADGSAEQLEKTIIKSTDFDAKDMKNLWFLMTNPRTNKIHSKMAFGSQLFAILLDFHPPQGVPKPPQTSKNPKKSRAKKSIKNRASTEPPKMSFDYFWVGPAQIEGVRVLATLSQENPNFAWKVLHFSLFRKTWFFKPQRGIDNPQLACAAPCRT